MTVHQKMRRLVCKFVGHRKDDVLNCGDVYVCGRCGVQVYR